MALLDSPSLLEGAFCIPAARALLVSDNLVLVGAHTLPVVQVGSSAPSCLLRKPHLPHSASRVCSCACPRLYDGRVVSPSSWKKSSYLNLVHAF